VIALELYSVKTLASFMGVKLKLSGVISTTRVVTTYCSVTPPISNVAEVGVDQVADELKRTLTVSQTVTVLGVEVYIQLFTLYSGNQFAPLICIGIVVFISLTVILFETYCVNIFASLTSLSVKLSGVLSVTGGVDHSGGVDLYG
jgi:hypothetical protein